MYTLRALRNINYGNPCDQGAHLKYYHSNYVKLHIGYIVHDTRKYFATNTIREHHRGNDNKIQNYNT